MMCVMENNVSYVGLGSGGKNTGTYTTNVGMSPETGVTGAVANNTYVTEVNTSIDLLNQRPSDINQPALPEIFNQLKSDEAKQEFRTFWNLVQRIKSNPNAHKVDEGKRLITTEPLNLYRFFLELKMLPSNDFKIENFLNNLGITLRDAELTKASLTNADLTKAGLYNANLTNAHLYNANLSEACLTFADLSEAKLRNANLQKAYLQKAVLYKADLQEADLQGAELQGAELYKADLQEADLQGADLREADLSEAKLRNANLQKAYLQKAKLLEADLTNADLTNAGLTNANLRYIFINKKTNFTGTLLQNIQCDCIKFQNEQGFITKIEDQEKIREKFIELGAKNENISFAQAA
jgi:uncharacterized protein YjbI with pentapeptide repeats